MTTKEQNNRYYTSKLTLLQLMGVLALLGIFLTCFLRYFFPHLT